MNIGKISNIPVKCPDFYLIFFQENSKFWVALWEYILIFFFFLNKLGMSLKNTKKINSTWEFVAKVSPCL